MDSFETGRPNAQGQGGGRILDVAGQWGREVVLKIGQFLWDVISASFLKKCKKLLWPVRGYAINFWRQNLRNVHRLKINKEIRKAKKNDLNNLNVRNISDIKQFRKTVKPFFSNKVGNYEKIGLIEEGKVVSEIFQEVGEKFKSYFEILLENLGINGKLMSEEPVSNESVTDIIKKF